MNNIPRPQGDVLRRNAEHECGTPVGQVNVMIQDLGLQSISFYCNQPRLHIGACLFRGKEVEIRRVNP